MTIYKTKSFGRFQRRENMTDASLIDAIERAEAGLIDADLGNGLIKQRIARQGQGRRGGYRTIIAYVSGEKAFFLVGFAKSGQANISAEDERDLADYGALLIGLDEAEIELMLAEDKLREVT